MNLADGGRGREGAEPGSARESAQARIDVDIPSPARVYDYWLGGKDNYASDRAVSEHILAVAPELPALARANRAFLGRAVRHLAGEAGVRQFLDVGTGLPTAENTHQVAQSVAPDSRVVYADNDPIVLAHARALLVGSDPALTSYADADLRDPAAVLAAAADTLDLSAPVAVILLGVLEFVPDTGEATEIVRRLMAAVPSGSHLVISHGLRGPRMDAAIRPWNESGATPIVNRSREEILGFFDGLDLLDPGLVPLTRWRPGPDGPAGDLDESLYVAAVGRKP
ncbi:SAM-dependent methyltransferase [Bailinhaonella thermotolerans]|uniref:SAM-dependent methyltransferase n=1 Tax=Bailinhaonella thermotolerans TaxID=1070861 RepID=A0A3A4B222_9ACTN|nr:SAM-dependent methyltransferase [Bailinhaonella thermotolerans]RJL35785.1 SAM-dependent methyltransferase [Bailinhaonella thermotolerans]